MVVLMIVPELNRLLSGQNHDFPNPYDSYMNLGHAVSNWLVI